MSAPQRMQQLSRGSLTGELSATYAAAVVGEVVDMTALAVEEQTRSAGRARLKDAQQCRAK